MASKESFQKQVTQTLLKSGFKDLFDQNEHKEFIEMIAATYFTNELTFDGMIEYLTDIVQDENKRKSIAQIIRDIKTPKVEKKPQQQKQKEEKVEKKPQKKVKTQNPHKPKQSKETKSEKSEDVKKQSETQKQPEASNNGQKKGLKQELETSGKTKCRFFPFCKNPDTCVFFHPTEKCQYFPNCRYGENCLYIHEACKFKQNCTKMNCPYAHPGKRPANSFETLIKSMMMGKNPAMFKKPQQKRKPNQHQNAGNTEEQQQQ